MSDDKDVNSIQDTVDGVLSGNDMQEAIAEERAKEGSLNSNNTSSAQPSKNKRKSSVENSSEKSNSASESSKPNSSSDNDSESQAENESESNSSSASASSNKTSSVDSSGSDSSSSDSAANSSFSPDSVASATTSEVKSDYQARSTTSDTLAEERDKAFRVTLNDEYDANPYRDTQKANQVLRKYIKYAKQDYQHRPTQSVFTEHLKLLLEVQRYMVHAILSSFNEYNHSTAVLMNQTEYLSTENHEMCKYNPPKEMSILVDWARKGVPSQLQTSLNRLIELGHDPAVMAEVHRAYDKDEKIPAPKPIKTKGEEAAEAHAKFVRKTKKTTDKAKNGGK